ncbi:MAG: hypothetical protein K8R54_17860 [Bacteroidales bacterium]|nr:hypothetical protein [Bacteroidales bacterium]
MKKNFSGKRYNFQIEIDYSTGYFEIYSQYKETNQISCITNLNYLLSEFNSYYKRNDEVDETTWVIKNTERLKMLFKTTNKNFDDIRFISHLEQQLDIDRNYGGWNCE